MARHGDRERLAIEVGERLNDVSRRVDVWAAGRWLTCADNSVYVPYFAGTLQHETGRFLCDPRTLGSGRPYQDLSVADNHRRLLSDAETDNDEYLAYRFMDWGPTADNVQMTLFCENGVAHLPFSFWRPRHHDPAELGQVFVAELPVWELASVLHDAAWELVWAWAAKDG